jgi:hypothetical protein
MRVPPLVQLNIELSLTHFWLMLSQHGLKRVSITLLGGSGFFSSTSVQHGLQPAQLGRLHLQVWQAGHIHSAAQGTPRDVLGQHSTL